MDTTHNTPLINEEVENFDLIAALAKLGTLIDLDGILVDIETYIHYVGEIA